VETTTPREFFERVLLEKFDPKKAAGFEAAIQANITGPDGGNWTITVMDQKMEVKQGTHQSPTITIKMADTDFVNMVNGKLSGVRALMTGKLELEGNIATAMKLREIGFM
jgi:putative sterol carrier protein